MRALALRGRARVVGQRHRQHGRERTRRERRVAVTVRGAGVVVAAVREAERGAPLQEHLAVAAHLEVRRHAPDARRALCHVVGVRGDRAAEVPGVYGVRDAACPLSTRRGGRYPHELRGLPGDGVAPHVRVRAVERHRAVAGRRDAVRERAHVGEARHPAHFRRPRRVQHRVVLALGLYPPLQDPAEAAAAPVEEVAQGDLVEVLGRRLADLVLLAHLRVRARVADQNRDDSVTLVLVPRRAAGGPARERFEDVLGGDVRCVFALDHAGILLGREVPAGKAGHACTKCHCIGNQQLISESRGHLLLQLLVERLLVQHRKYAADGELLRFLHAQERMHGLIFTSCLEILFIFPTCVWHTASCELHGWLGRQTNAASRQVGHKHCRGHCASQISDVQAQRVPQN